MNRTVPSPEETEGWTMADWQKLADDFIREFDAVSLKRKDRNANRIDMEGNTNNEYMIGKRATMAANKSAQRVGSAVHSERQVRTMVRDSFEEGNDGIMMHHYNMDDIDLDSLHRYRNHFKVRNDGHVWNEADDKGFLKNLGGYIVDRETGEEGPIGASLS
jgi:hypothetical protein